jgi:hypothetical protein
MRFIVNSRGEYYHIIEELQCPFKEKDIYIILKDDEVMYWQKASNYYEDMMVNVEMFKTSIEELELTNYRSQVRKDKTLVFLKEALSKMIAYKREIKINEVLDKTSKESVWLVC